MAQFGMIEFVNGTNQPISASLNVGGHDYPVNGGSPVPGNSTPYNIDASAQANIRSVTANIAGASHTFTLSGTSAEAYIHNLQCVATTQAVITAEDANGNALEGTVS